MTEKSENIGYYVNQLNNIFNKMSDLTNTPIAELKQLKKEWADEEASLKKQVDEHYKTNSNKPYDLINQRMYATAKKNTYTKELRSIVAKYRYLSENVEHIGNWCKNDGIYTQVYAKVKKLPSYIACKRIYGW